MDKDAQKKFSDSLKERLSEIDKELSAIASKNPLIKGDFDVKVEDMGESEEDVAQEAGELDRRKALVAVLERERKDIADTLEKIESGNYGKHSA